LQGIVTRATRPSASDEERTGWAKHMRLTDGKIQARRQYEIEGVARVAG
jgi:hypothetical protein